MKYRYLGIIFISICVVLLGGCGAGGGSAPPGSVITIGSFDPAVNTNQTKELDEQCVQVNVKDASGNGVDDAKVSVTFNYLSKPDQTVAPDPGSIVTMHGGAQILNASVDVYTDQWGVYDLCLDYYTGGGLSYSGNVKVFSGDQTASTTLTVSGSTISPTPTPTPTPTP